MRARGFTLVELMIVVAIIGVLAVIGTTAYSRYSHKARGSEAYAMLAEFRAKEEAYRAEYSVYCNSGASCSTLNPETAFYPALRTDGSEPILKSVLPLTSRPVAWLTLGINPGRDGLYCGYDAVAGTAATYGAIGTMGANFFSTAPPTGAFWYVLATCDLDGQTATNSLWITGSNTTNIHQENEGS